MKLHLKCPDSIGFYLVYNFVNFDLDFMELKNIRKLVIMIMCFHFQCNLSAENKLLANHMFSYRKIS